MKKNILFIFILFSMISFSEDSEEIDKGEKFKFDYKLSVGIMVGHENNLYKTGDSKDYNFNPFIEFEVNDVYISGSEIGYTYYLNERTSITVLTQLSGGLTLQGIGSAFGGDKIKGSKMEDGYKGIDDRESQIEVGLKINYETDYHELELSGEIQGGEEEVLLKHLFLEFYM